MKEVLGILSALVLGIVFSSTIVQDEGGVANPQLSRTEYITVAGRFNLYTDNRWVTDSTVAYGSNQGNWNQNCGTNAEPNLSWNHQGEPIKQGSLVKSLEFRGRSNNNQVTDLKIRAYRTTPNPATRWDTGVDTNAEVTNELIYSTDSVMSLVSGTDTNDKYIFSLEIPESLWLCSEDCELRVYVQPVGTLSQTRYWQVARTWEIVEP